MLRKAIAVIAVAICAGIAWTPAQAYTEARIPLSTLVLQAHTIVVGTVEETEGKERFFGDYLRVVTDTLIGNLEVVKGDVLATDISVIQLGGQAGDVMEWYPGLPAMETGKRYLIFLIESNGDILMPLGAQGFLSVVTDPDRGIEVLVSSSGRVVTGIKDDWVEYGAAAAGESASTGVGLDTAMPLGLFLDEVQSRQK